MGVLFLLLGSFFASQSAGASGFELVARAHVLEGYRLPRMTFIDNTSPAINDRGVVAFRIQSVGGSTRSAIWKGSARGGDVIYRAPEGKLLSDVAINRGEQVAFHQFEEDRSDGVFVLDSGELRSVLPTAGKGLLGAPALNDGTLVVAQALDPEGRQSVLLSSGQEVRAADHSVSYFFRPQLNAAGDWAHKVRRGVQGALGEEQPDEIWVWDDQGRRRAVLRDAQSDPVSEFEGFYNAVSMTRSGDVLVVARLKGGGKALVLAGRQAPRILLREGEHGIREFEYFTPKINDSGEVALRAWDGSGRRAIFFGDAFGWRRVIGEGDLLETDLGPGRVLHQEGFPGLSGEVSLNNGGQIAFHAVLADVEQEMSLGSAVFVWSGDPDFGGKPGRLSALFWDDTFFGKQGPPSGSAGAGVGRE